MSTVVAHTNISAARATRRIVFGDQFADDSAHFTDSAKAAVQTHPRETKSYHPNLHLVF
jgi:hypothetical protein